MGPELGLELDHGTTRMRSQRPRDAVFRYQHIMLPVCCSLGFSQGPHSCNALEHCRFNDLRLIQLVVILLFFTASEAAASIAILDGGLARAVVRRTVAPLGLMAGAALLLLPPGSPTHRSWRG